MQLSTILTTVLNLLATSPDLCADVYRDAAGEPYTDVIGQTLSRYCKWTGPDVPVWDADVCCTIDADGASCVTPDDNGRCWQGEKLYCKYGELIADGVICYQPFPDACDAGHCVKAPGGPSPAHGDTLACCNQYTCVAISNSQIWSCGENGGTILACEHGQTNSDGSVTCYDDF